MSREKVEDTSPLRTSPHAREDTTRPFLHLRRTYPVAVKGDMLNRGSEVGDASQAGWDRCGLDHVVVECDGSAAKGNRARGLP